MKNTNQSNTNGSNWGVGGTMSYGQNKENIDQVKNNYTTITSRKGKTNINTNDLTLTEIQRSSGSDNNTNNFNTDKVRGKIRENALTEKNENYSENWNVAFNRPVNIVRKNFKPKDGIIPTEDPNKVPVKQGDWESAFANTTFTYKDSNGYDFSVSPNSFKGSFIAIGTTGDLVFETLYKIPGFQEDDAIGRTIVGIAAAPFTVFGEQGSYLMDKDGKIRQEEVAREGTNYTLLGQSSGEKGVDNEFRYNQDLIARVNPTDGGIGDTIKSGIMKVFNMTTYTSNFIAMNRLVSNDLAQRAEVGHSLNTFHSQGTIIGVASMNILASQGIILDQTQNIKAVGPAVYETTWNNTASNIIRPTYQVISKDSPLGTPGTIINSNIQYKHNDNDGVRQVAAPSSPKDFFKGIYNLMFNIDQHGIDSYR